jgi:hypothetical protein
MEERDALRRILFHARHNDLVIMGRPRRSDGLPQTRLETLLLESGRPLLVASSAAPRSLLNTVMVCWKEEARAARAVSAGLSAALTATKAYIKARAVPAILEVIGMYKTILMHCNDKRRIRNLLLPAVDLSERYQAHLTALSVVPPIAIFTSVDGSVMTVDAHCQLYRQENPAMREAFEEVVRGTWSLAGAASSVLCTRAAANASGATRSLPKRANEGDDSIDLCCFKGHCGHGMLRGRNQVPQSLSSQIGSSSKCDKARGRSALHHGTRKMTTSAPLFCDDLAAVNRQRRLRIACQSKSYTQH